MPPCTSANATSDAEALGGNSCQTRRHCPARAATAGTKALSAASETAVVDENAGTLGAPPPPAPPRPPAPLPALVAVAPPNPPCPPPAAPVEAPDVDWL